LELEEGVAGGAVDSPWKTKARMVAGRAAARPQSPPWRERWQGARGGPTSVTAHDADGGVVESSEASSATKLRQLR
jgi:hypothetical protein